MKATWTNGRELSVLIESVRMKIATFTEHRELMRTKIHEARAIWKKLNWFKRWNTTEPGTYYDRSDEFSAYELCNNWVWRLERLLDVLDTTSTHNAATIILSDEEIRLVHATDKGMKQLVDL